MSTRANEPLSLERLIKLLKLLASDQPGEVVAAAGRVNAMLKDHDVTWEHLLVQPPRRGIKYPTTRLDRWMEEHPDEYAWVAANSDNDRFAASLWEGLQKYGSLTERQMAAVQRNLERDNHQPRRRAYPGSGI